MVQAVLFDMDGVLVDSGPPHLLSWRKVAERHGVDVTDERFQRTFGRPSRDIIRILWDRAVSDDEIAAIDAEKEAIYRDLVRDRVPLMPGCKETLARLHGLGLRLAVATSGPPENLDLVLDAGAIRPFFHATVNGFEIRHGKPAPDCFLLAAERVGIPPAACVVVEDAPVGVQAGVAAGMVVIGFAPNGDEQRLRDAGAQHVVARFEQIAALVRPG